MTDALDYADDLFFQMLVEYISDGTTLADACRLLGLARTTVYRKAGESPRAVKMLQDARESGHDVIAENTRKVARGQEGFSSGDPKRDKLIVETDLKLLAKWDRRYRESLQVETKSASVAIPVSNDPVEAQRAYERLMSGS